MSLCQPVIWSMAAMLRDSTVVVAVVHMHPRTIPLAMITMRKSTHGFPFVSHIWVAYGAPLGGPSGHRSSAIITINLISVLFLKKQIWYMKELIIVFPLALNGTHLEKYKKEFQSINYRRQNWGHIVSTRKVTAGLKDTGGGSAIAPTFSIIQYSHMPPVIDIFTLS